MRFLPRFAILVRPPVRVVIWSIAVNSPAILQAVFNRYLANWQHGVPTPPEDILDELPEGERAELLVPLVAIEVASRRLAGEAVDAAELEARFERFPGVATRVLSLKPSQLRACLAGEWEDAGLLTAEILNSTPSLPLLATAIFSPEEANKSEASTSDETFAFTGRQKEDSPTLDTAELESETIALDRARSPSGFDRAHGDEVTLDFQAELERVRKEYERAAEQGEAPRIEDLLDGYTGDRRELLLTTLLGLELRLVAGPDAEIEGYLARFPDHHSAVRAAFETRRLAATHSSSAQRIGDYEIVNVLGAGGMGLVYRARQMRADRIVALKVIQSDQANDAAIERFKAEAQAAARIDHDHIVTVYEVGEDQGQHFFSMKLVDGESLLDRLDRGSIDLRDGVRYIAEAARAVAAAHSKGVLHRDIKPANILIERETNRALVTDFGLAKLHSESGGSQLMTHAGAVFGTPAYMPPEQTEDAGNVTAAADVYSLGATLFHLLSGHPPFRGSSLHSTLKQVVESPTPRLKQAAPGTPLDLDTICQKAMEKEPGRRFESAHELADELERFLRDEPIHSRQITGIERGLRWCRRNKLLTGLAVLGVTLLVVAGVAALHASRAERLRDAAERNQQIADRTVHIDDMLALPSLKPAAIQELIVSLGTLQTLAPDKGAAVRKRAKETYCDHIIALIRRRQRPDAVAITSAVEALAPLLGADSEKLGRELESRLNEWNEFFRLDLQDAQQQIPAPLARGEQGLQRDIEEVKGFFVLTDVDCPSAGSRLEAEFVDWDADREVGLLLNVNQETDEAKEFSGLDGGYQFLFRADHRRIVSFEKSRLDDNTGWVIIARNARQLRRFPVPLAELPADQPLRMRATRVGTRLELQLNDLSPFAYNEVFGTTVNGGKYGLSWDKHAALSSLTASVRELPATASDLEKGDLAFSRQAFAEALELFEAEIGSSDDAVRNEARLKHALCLLRLERAVDAEAELGEVALNSHDRWGMLAACHLWLRYLESDQFDEASALLTNVETRFSFRALSDAVPQSTRRDIIRHYRRNANVGNAYLRVTPSEDRIEKLQRALAVEELLNRDAISDYRVRFDLIRSYWQAGELDAAQGMLEEMMEFENLPVKTQVRVLELYAWFMTVRGRAQEAIAAIREELFIDETEVKTSHLNLILPLARLHGVEENWERAAALARAGIQAKQQINRRPDSGLYLLQGVALRMLGKEDKAMEVWRAGHESARENGKLTALPAAVMGSLCGEMQPADVDQMVKEVTQGNQGSSAMAFMAKGMIPSEMLYAVPRTMWRNQRGLPWAKKIALRDVTQEEMLFVQVKLVGYNTWRNMVVGIDNSKQRLTPMQDEVIWRLANEHVEAYRRGETTELHIVQMAQTYKGILGLFGWGGLGSVPDHVRQPIAYAFACHFHRQGKVKETGMFLDVAGATDDPKLQQLVREARAKFTAEPAEPTE